MEGHFWNWSNRKTKEVYIWMKGECENHDPRVFSWCISPLLGIHLIFFMCLQRIGTSYSFPWFDSSLCIGVILHGVCDSKPEFNFFFPSRGREITLSFVYLLAGYYSYLSGLALAPYLAFYAMAAIGVISFIFRIIQKRNREKGEAYFSSSRKHSHRHWWRSFSLKHTHTCLKSSEPILLYNLNLLFSDI